MKYREFELSDALFLFPLRIFQACGWGRDRKILPESINREVVLLPKRAGPVVVLATRTDRLEQKQTTCSLSYRKNDLWFAQAAESQEMLTLEFNSWETKLEEW